MKDSAELVDTVENLIYSYHLVSVTAAVQFARDDWDLGKSAKSQQVGKELQECG